MQIALITDLHFGEKQNSHRFLQYQKKYYETQFFPFLHENSVKNVIILGDTFDNRRNIDISILKEVQDFFFQYFEDNEINVYIIVGNHDIYYKSTNNVSSIELFTKSYKFIHVISKPTKLHNIDLIPWISPSNQEEIFNFIQDSDSNICMGHFEINGFDMYKGWVANTDHGLDKDILSRYTIVFSGHYHQPSLKSNICYVGAPYQMRWNDYGCERGFRLLDTDSPADSIYIKNKVDLFIKIYYDSSFDIESFPYEYHIDKYINVYVEDKENEDKFNLFIENLKDIDTFNLEVIDNSSLRYEENNFDKDAIAKEDILTLFRNIMPDESLFSVFDEIHKVALEKE
jgi:DNA repair exonuclease SbcCD nuclease subunit